ncbi:MAG: hypothetical protein ACR2NM_07350, partial [Bythopirellula sp.]
MMDFLELTLAGEMYMRILNRMSESKTLLLQAFDPNAEVRVVERQLPHWMQAGTLCYITFRTEDS